MLNTTADYKSVIFSGCSIESRGVSVCNLEDFMMGQFVPRAKYQVWSDRHKFYRLYHNIDDAVEKFIELRRKR
jgi:hypothetical protein